MYKKLCLLLLPLALLCMSAHGQSQHTALVTGKLTNSATGEPANDIPVTIKDTKFATTSDGEGSYTFSQVPYGTHTLVIGGGSTKTFTQTIVVNKPTVEIGNNQVESNDKNTTNNSIAIPTIALDDNNVSLEDDGVKIQNVSGLLTASRDPFVNAAAFVFGQYRFQPRGYDRSQQQIYVNGIAMNDIETGVASWSQWGGLNDIFRARENTYGLGPSDYGFGGLTGDVYFDATAANQRKGVRISYMLTNSTYRDRIMATYNTGLMKNGWAFSASASRRWANQGYIPGTYYDAYSYYAGASKNWKKHQFNFVTFGSPTKRGKSGAETQEGYDLAGNNFYNPNWGYQNGQVRNARVADYFQPQFILSHEYKPNENTKWTTAIGYQFGKNKNSSLDWYNGSDPRPDYYKNFPSYYADGYYANPTAVQEITQQYQNNPELLQINWNRLYQDNYMNTETVNNANGIAGNTVTGKRSIYVLANDVDDTKKWNFNTNLIHSMGSHVTLYTGLTGIAQQTESYKELADLLGGDYYLNYNQFAARDFIGNNQIKQNDLNHPDQVVKVGDKYGYDYVAHYLKGWWWGQAAFKYNKVDFFVAATAGVNSFYREGLYRSGLFPTHSYGDAPMQSFDIYSAKGGVTYKIDGRNYLFLNGSYSADAPAIENTYVSIRSRDFTIDNPTTQKTASVEGGYLLHSPGVNARVVGYVTDMKDVVQVQHYYNDFYQSFSNYVIQGLNIRSIGTELALDVKLTKSFTVTGVASLGQIFYTNRPKVSAYLDNDTTVTVRNQNVYIKNFYVGAGPQSVYTLGLNYQSKHYWFARINTNYLTRNYVGISVDHYTPDAVGLWAPGSPQWNDIIDQQELPNTFTVDCSIGKSFQLSKAFGFVKDDNMLLQVNAGIRNLFNTTFINSGFENGRFDYTDNSTGVFAPKYIYGLGRNYTLNVTLKF